MKPKPKPKPKSIVKQVGSFVLKNPYLDQGGHIKVDNESKQGGDQSNKEVLGIAHVGEESEHLVEESTHVGEESTQMGQKHVVEGSAHMGGESTHVGKESAHIGEESLQVGEESPKVADRNMSDECTSDSEHTPVIVKGYISPVRRHSFRPKFIPPKSSSKAPLKPKFNKFCIKLMGNVSPPKQIVFND